MPTRSLIQKLAKLFPQSLIAEIYRIFGLDNTEKLILVFAGTTIHIPSTKDLEEEDRNLAIYETLQKSNSAAESRRLGHFICEQYGLKRKELRIIYKKTKKKLKEAKKFTESDQLVSAHLPKKIKLKRETRRRL